MDPFLFSDVGYRFRKNILDLWDTIGPYDGFDDMTFFDFLFYNHDTYEIDESITTLAEIYFRLEID